MNLRNVVRAGSTITMDHFKLRPRKNAAFVKSTGLLKIKEFDDIEIIQQGLLLFWELTI